MRIIAHRGYSAAFPENTALAFDQAIAAGAHLIETDVRLTRDGHAVCWHDPDLLRINGDSRQVAKLTLAEFRALALPRGQSPLDLQSVLELARGRSGVMLDVKIGTENLLQLIVAALQATGMMNDVVYGVRDAAQYNDLLEHAPGIKALAMPADPDALPEHLEPCVSAVRLWEPEVTAERVARIHEAGREAWVTAGRRADGEAAGYLTGKRVAELEHIGIDAVLVNDPVLALAARTPKDTTGKEQP